MKKLLIYLLLVSWQLSAKVLIITHSYNRPEFIEMQYKTFKKFLLDDYEYVVFNDARDSQIAMQINAACEKMNIKTIRIPQEIHTRPYLQRERGDNFHQNNIRHANCIHYSLDVLGWDYDGIVGIMDSDMFLIRPLSISMYMQDKHIASFMKRASSNIRCLCPVLCFLAMNKIPDKKELNFNCGKINGWMVDSGGFTHYYLIKHPELQVKSLNSLYSHQLFLGDIHINRKADNVPKEVKAAFYANLGFNDKEIRFLLKRPDTFEFYFDNNFLHYRDGSNDTRQSPKYHLRKFQIFSDFIADILQDN